jgi:hypothetical protein
MSLDTRDSVTTRNAATDAKALLWNSGKVRIYDGTRPATPETALSGNTLLAEPTMNATAFGASSGGTATANAITADSSADATGTATFARVFKSDGTTVITDLEVGTGTANIVLNTTSIVAGASVSISSLTLSTPMQGA